jgi:hypothetical protein
MLRVLIRKQKILGIEITRAPRDASINPCGAYTKHNQKLVPYDVRERLVHDPQGKSERAE